MPQPLDMANIAALNQITEFHKAEADRAAEAAETARRKAEELRQQRAGGQA
ncbi:hypothetical protein ACWC5I_40780 [Kitasatospora sp. NPDC001574]